MFYTKLKNFINTLIALFLFALVFFFAQSLQVRCFASLGGRPSFYLYSASSQAMMKEKIEPWEAFFLKGESVVFPYEDRQKTLEKILRTYEAQICFKEEAGGSTSYYCHTLRWTDGIKINGSFINLHIAFQGEYCAVGTPIIFGGF